MESEITITECVSNTYMLWFVPIKIQYSNLEQDRSAMLEVRTDWEDLVSLFQNLITWRPRSQFLQTMYKFGHEKIEMQAQLYQVIYINYLLE